MRSTCWSLRACCGIALFAACGIPVKSQMLEMPSFGTVGAPQNGCERESFVGTALTSAAANAVLPQRTQEQVGPNLIKYTQNDIHTGATALGYGLYRVGSDEPMKLSRGLRIVSPSMANYHDSTSDAWIRARLDRQARWGKWVFVGLGAMIIGAGVAIGGVTSDSGDLLKPGLLVMAGGIAVTTVGMAGAISNRVMPGPATEAVVKGVVSTDENLPSVVDQYNVAVRRRCQPAALPAMSSTPMSALPRPASPASRSSTASPTSPASL